MLAILAAVFVFAAAGLAESDETSAATEDNGKASGDDGNIHWETVGDTMTFTKREGKTSGDMKDYGKGDHPWNDAGYSNLVISEGITKIGKFAFYDCDFTTLTIASTVTHIGNGAFEECTNFTGSLVIPSGVTYLGEYAFKKCPITELTIPICLDEVIDDDHDNEVFCECKKIAKINFTVGFSGEGYSYTEDERNNTPQYWSRGVLSEVTFQEGITKIGDRTFYMDTHITTIKFPSTLTVIGTGAFEECTGISGSLVIPDGVTYLGAYAFKKCSPITELTLPISLNASANKDKDKYSFYGCSNIVKITFTKGTGVGYDYDNDIRKGTPWYISKDKLTTAVFQDGITHLGTDALYGAKNVTSVDIPSSVTSIGGSAFEDTGLAGVLHIPDRVTSIGGYQFQNCDGITFVSIPNSVQTIEKYAFQKCDGLSTVIIPDSVTSLGAGQFMNCPALSNLTMPITLDPIQDSKNPVFMGSNKIQMLTYTKGTDGVGVNIDQKVREKTPGYISKDQLLFVKFVSGIVSLGSYTAYGCGNISIVSLPDTVTAIGTGAFEQCKSLQTVSIPDSVTSIGVQAFQDCTSLTDLTVPITLDIVGDSKTYPPFRNCSNLNNITFTAGTDGAGVQYDNTKRVLTPQYQSRGMLTSVTFAYGVTAIGDNTLYGCSKIGSVPLPSSLVSIGNSAFEGCTSMKELELPVAVTSVGNDQFKNCHSLSRIVIDQALASLGTGNFNIAVFYDSDGKTELSKTAQGLRGYSYACLDPLNTKMVRLYTVTFDAEGGTADVQSEETNTSGKLDSLPKATREGYDFQGWYTQASGGTQITTDTFMKSNVTAHAHWTYAKPDTVTITPSKISMNIGQRFVPTVTTDPVSSAPIMWSSSDKSKVAAGPTGILVAMAEGEVTITATVNGVSGTMTVIVNKNPEYTVVFDGNGGTSDVESLQTVNRSLPYLPEATRECYVFAGWFTKATSGTRITTDTSFTKDTVVYAHWDPIPVTGVELSRETLRLSVGAEIQLIADVKPSDATERGVTWTSSDKTVATVDSDGNIRAVGEGNATITVTTKDGGHTDTCTVTVAQFGIVHKVAFDANGGTSSISQLATDLDWYLPYLPNAVRDRYVFSGWFTDPVGGSHITAGTQFTSPSTTVYAHWQEIPVTQIILSQYEIVLLLDQNPVSLGVGIVPQNQTHTDINWSTSDFTVVKVMNGRLIPTGVGTAVVRAEIDGVYAECAVTVLDQSTRVYQEFKVIDDIAVISNMDEVLEQIRNCVDTQKIPYFDIACENCGKVLLPSEIVRSLYTAMGIFDASTPAGYLYIDSYALPYLVLSGNNSVLGIQNVDVANGDLNIVSAIDCSLYDEYGTREPTHFGVNVEVGIKYDLNVDDLEYYSVYYIPSSGSAQKIEIAGYEDGYVYFYTEHLSTFALVYDKPVPPEPVPEKNWFVPAIVALIVVIAILGGTYAVVRKYR